MMKKNKFVLLLLCMLFIVNNVCLGKHNYKIYAYAFHVNYKTLNGSFLLFKNLNIKEKYIPSYTMLDFSERLNYGYDSVCLYYTTQFASEFDFFDLSNYKLIAKDYCTKKCTPAGTICIKDIKSGKELYIYSLDLTIEYNNNIYDLKSDEKKCKFLINLIGKVLPTSLRENLEIHYDYRSNQFYIGTVKPSSLEVGDYLDFIR